jgi:hypothetical protein
MTAVTIRRPPVLTSGYGSDLPISVQAAVISVYDARDAEPAHTFLCDHYGLRYEPSGEDQLILVLHGLARQIENRLHLTIKGNALAERIVRRVMENL